MEEICNDEVEQVSGGTYQDQRNLQDFLDRIARERGNYPGPVPSPDPGGW